MADKDDYIDELNWYSEDFTPPESKSERKTDRKPTKAPRVKSVDKEKRSRRLGESSSYSRSTSVVDTKKSSRAEKVSFDQKPYKKVTRTRQLVEIKKATQSVKPEIKLYEPVKSYSRIKEAESVASQPFVKTVKHVDPSPKSETVKTPEQLSHFTKSAVNNKVVKLLSEKLTLLEERDKLIRSSLEKPSNLKQAHAIKGTCPDMCPEKERIMRCFKKMVSVFECPPNSTEMDHRLAVKEYARSSADQEEPLPHDLRPEPVLTMSMSYIVTRIITTFEECEDISAWYDFCWNRLRAIRKDIVQQQLCDLETVVIVEQCARFHIICFDRFWGMDSSIFDEKINTENLMNCLKILLNLYGDLRKLGTTCPNEPEFNAYMILIKMNSGDLLWEYLNFPLSLQQTPEVIEAVKIHMFYNGNMYSQFFNHLLKTSYLNACLMQRCFTQLRVRALGAIIKAYCPPNKEGKLPLQHIIKSLKFDTKEDTLAFCRSCNIWYIERVGFKISHSRFIRPETLLKIKTPSSLVCSKRVDFAQAMVGVYNDLPVYFEHGVHNSFLNDKSLHADALDASDQEEKMLRDNVERKLLLKTLKKSPKKESQFSLTAVPSAPILHRSLSSMSDRRRSSESEPSAVKQSEKPVVETSFTPEPEDIEMEGEMSESEDYDMPEALSTEQAPTQIVDEDTNNVFVDAQDVNSLESNKEMDLGIFLDSQHISPLSAISDEPIEEISDHEEEEEEDEEVEVESAESSDEVMEGSSSPVIYFPSTSPVPCSSVTFNIPASKENEVSSPITSPTERRLSFSSQRENRLNLSATKLKSKLRIDMQRISARKYGRIWREKVRDIKKSYGFVPLVSHVNMREYLSMWGHCVTKHGTILNQLDNTKKLCSSVDSLLLYNMFDNASLKKLAYPVCKTLVDKKLKIRSFESVNENVPIYWKLVISVPSSNISNYDLYRQVSSWSDQVFFTSENARKTKIESMIFKGVKVHCKITVAEGCEKLDGCKNLSALIMLNVPGWESSEESQDRLDRLVSVSNRPVPVCTINLAPSQTSFAPPSKLVVPFFSEITANPTTDFDNILRDLASNSCEMSVKSRHVCDLTNEMLDRFLDALQDDCYNSTGFLTAMSDPTNIVYLYNILIGKLKEEILRLYDSNIFGTANEIISSSGPNSKHSDSVPSLLGGYFDSLEMNELQWPPNSSGELLTNMKDYCDKSGIAQVLSHVIRMINPPDDDDTELPLTEFLNNLRWLQILEVIIKAHYRTKFCDVIVTYSEKSLSDLIGAHWWMECSLIAKYCSN